MSSDGLSQRTLRGAYRCLRENTDIGPIAAILHTPIFYVVAYRHAEDIAAATGVRDGE